MLRPNHHDYRILSFTKVMNALIVYAHPEPRSFNGAMLQRALALSKRKVTASKSAIFMRRGFDPVSGPHNFTDCVNPILQADKMKSARVGNNGFAPDVQAEMDELNRADLLIFQFPLWWFGVPPF
jgi:NAD(P)H dehydrogenase (quinone)